MTSEVVAIGRPYLSLYEVMRLVSLLDGLNRYRFSGNAEMRAAWESAKNVVSGPSAVEEPTDSDSAAGEVRPAA